MMRVETKFMTFLLVVRLAEGFERHVRRSALMAPAHELERIVVIRTLAPTEDSFGPQRVRGSSSCSGHLPASYASSLFCNLVRAGRDPSSRSGSRLRHERSAVTSIDCVALDTPSREPPAWRAAMCSGRARH